MQVVQWVFMGRKNLMSHAIVKGTQLRISNLRATLSMQIWIGEEISSRNPMVLQECVIRYTISHMFQEILALEILSKPMLLASRRNSIGKRLNLLCWKNYVTTLSEMHTTLTADIASLLTSWTKLKASSPPRMFSGRPSKSFSGGIASGGSSYSTSAFNVRDCIDPGSKSQGQMSTCFHS